MNAPALARVGVELPDVRGFNFADMEKHGRWMMPRLLKALPHLDQRMAETWLRGAVYSNEFKFLFQEHSVALAQVLRNHGTAAKPVVQEIFVWCEDPEDKAHQKEAAEFYSQLAVWAKHLGTDIVMVQESSDVPHDMIKEKLGRLFERKTWFARV